MPGCQLFADAMLVDTLFATGATAAWSWTLPAGSQLLGVRFYQQGFVFDPAANAAGLVASNAAAATIGW